MPFNSFLKSLGIPGLISCISLLLAWTAIVFALEQDLRWSINFAVLAFVFDTLDGYAARKLKRVSELGRQLDSMVDLINYSVYSAVVVYVFLLPGTTGAIVGSIILLFGLLRLVRFNAVGYVEQKHTLYYSGVVTCHLSLATVGLVLVQSQLSIPSLLIILLLVSLAVLQLSSIKTRKTGMLPLWYGVCLIILLGANIWFA